jgi:hypothetical protein
MEIALSRCTKSWEGRKNERKKERKAGGLDWKVYSLHARVSKVSEKKSG